MSMNKAHISQTKFELNPPGLDQQSFAQVNNGVVLIMNQSQREYYKAQSKIQQNSRGLKLLPLQGTTNETKQRVLNLIHNERGMGRKGNNSRQSDGRNGIGSKGYARNFSHHGS